jgi:hypothetical protein
VINISPQNQISSWCNFMENETCAPILILTRLNGGLENSARDINMWQKTYLPSLALYRVYVLCMKIIASPTQHRIAKALVCNVEYFTSYVVKHLYYYLLYNVDVRSEQEQFILFHKSWNSQNPEIIKPIDLQFYEPFHFLADTTSSMLSTYPKYV